MIQEELTPYSKYIFTKDPDTKTSYILSKQQGEKIPEFMTQWKKGKKKGLWGVNFDNPQDDKLKEKFDKMLSAPCKIKDPTTGNLKRPSYTGVNVVLQYKGMYCGNYTKQGLQDAILIRFENNNQKMTVLFFKGYKDCDKTLFQKMTAGELCETVTENILPLPADKKKAGVLT